MTLEWAASPKYYYFSPLKYAQLGKVGRAEF